MTIGVVIEFSFGDEASGVSFIADRLCLTGFGSFCLLNFRFRFWFIKGLFYRLFKTTLLKRSEVETYLPLVVLNGNAVFLFVHLHIH